MVGFGCARPPAGELLLDQEVHVFLLAVGEALPSRLHQQGRVVGRGKNRLYVRFDLDHKLVSLRPHVVPPLDLAPPVAPPATCRECAPNPTSLPPSLENSQYAVLR